mmetsp:Transcript_30303/g.76243  ORF Transcript_30303/g.76243 Transcript_30303/m.76243 type:complete len:104 (+) Transcript_30303:1771-2082(+)
MRSPDTMPEACDLLSPPSELAEWETGRKEGMKPQEAMHGIKARQRSTDTCPVALVLAIMLGKGRGAVECGLSAEKSNCFRHPSQRDRDLCEPRLSFVTPLSHP